MNKVKTIGLTLIALIAAGTMLSAFMGIVIAIAQLVIIGMIVWGLYHTITQAVRKDR